MEDESPNAGLQELAADFSSLTSPQTRERAKRLIDRYGAIDAVALLLEGRDGRNAGQ